MTSTIKRWLPTLVWLVLIFYLSNQPDLPSAQFGWLDFLEKKAAHVIEYFILTLLLYRSFGYAHLDRAILFSLGYAFSDEAHQLFIYGRTGRLRDVAIDGTGITLASIFITKLKLWLPLKSPILRKKQKA